MPLRSVLAAVAVAVIWGFNFVVIDLGLDGMPPALFVAMRFVAVLIPAIFFVPRPKAHWREVMLIGLFMSLGQFGLLYTALAIGMPAGLASLVLQAQVVFTVIFAALALREVPSRPQLIGVVVGAMGLFVVGSGRGADTPALAFFVTLAAAASWALGNVVARRIGRAAVASSPRSGLSLTVWSALVVPVPLVAAFRTFAHGVVSARRTGAARRARACARWPRCGGVRAYAHHGAAGSGNGLYGVVGQPRRLRHLEHLVGQAPGFSRCALHNACSRCRHDCGAVRA